VLLAVLLAPMPGSAQGRPDPLPGRGRVVIDGELELTYQDDETSGRLLGFLHSQNRRVPLRFQNGVAPNLPTGSRVRVSGDLADGVVTATDVSALSVSATQTIGTRQVLVILFNFSTNATQPFSISTVNSVNDQVKSFYRENSYGLADMNFTVAGYFTITASTSTCDYYTWATQAETAATNAGFNLSAYDRRVLAFPRVSACSWSGMGNVSGPRSWVNGSYALRTVAHEQGHNFGDHHSQALRCDTASLCTTVEYGDDRDVLGASGVVGHMNAFQKERLGWLNYGSSPTIQTIATSGDYWIGSYEANVADAKALRVWNAANSTYYYVESRARTGFDSGLTAGVTVHVGSPSNGYGQQVDLSPTTTTYDSTLDVGQTFADPALGVYITTLSTGTAGALVRVEFGGQLSCVSGAPGVTLSPSSQFGASGSVLIYAVTVANTDGSACAASPFALAASVPAGWTASFSSTPTLAPGASAQVTMSVAVPSGASGTNAFNVTAQNRTSGAGGSAIASATVAASLAVTSAATVSGGKNNRAITVNVAVGVNSTPVAGAAVTVTITRPFGGSVALAATTGADGRASVRYSVRRSDPAGTYQVRADASSGGVTGTASTTVNVQ
jgi:hypothetical protein